MTANEIEEAGILTFNGVSAERGGHILFADLSFTLNPGELLWIQGDNGIGKTTLLRMAAGLTPPHRGQVKWISAQDGTLQFANNMVSYQSHGDAFKSAFTASEELGFWAKMYGYTEPLTDILRMVGLEFRTHVPTGKLSAGQRRRLALARLLVSRRGTWILDEPNAAMDADGQALTEYLMTDHVDKGGSIMIASHSDAKSLGSNARRLALRRPQ